MHIAVVDDEPDITALLAGYLGRQGWRISELHAGAPLLALMNADPPDLVLLDLGLGREDGLVIARHLREHWRCGLIIVTGRGDAVDKVVGLEIGADDYVTKPFDLRELLARIKAVLRRSHPPEGVTGPVPLAPMMLTTPITPPNPLRPLTPTAAIADAPERFQFAGWQLDVAARELRGPEGPVALTSGEFDLLCAFARHPGRVLSRDFLLEHTRGREASPFDRTIDVQVGRLRKKMEADPAEPQLIKSVRNAGYILVPPVARG